VLVYWEKIKQYITCIEMYGGLGVVTSVVEQSLDMKMRDKIKSVFLYKDGSSCGLCIVWQPFAIQVMINQEQSGDLECVNY